ncbi:hypothetical protein [Sphingomonas sp. MMS24-J13]|uniref:hypothetical protein n=1 Tax=Sphingomonas sp. MMS24-J13 TaxID=3238686 RepID=UPI00384D1A1C
MIERRFLTGFAAALISLGLVLCGLQWLFTRAGELNLSHVVARQLAAPNGTILFLSGVNQNAYRYKELMFDRQQPEGIAIGSSRAMEVRSDFFTLPFLSLGGSVNNLDNLETMAAHVAAGRRLKLALIYVDPWLFNARYTDNQAPVPDYPRWISADTLSAGARAMVHGNWVLRVFRSPNLGLHGLVNDEGYARDGSVYYNLTGSQPADRGFATTFDRINGDKQNFQRNSRADPVLVSRICSAIAKVRGAADHVVVVAPPFASPIWRRLARPDYDYIRDGYRRLSACAGAPLFDFTDPAAIEGSNDCEFIDGLHGGDVTYARLLRQVGERDPKVRRWLRAGSIERFVGRYGGRAGGSRLQRDPGLREADFLKLGCVK